MLWGDGQTWRCDFGQLYSPELNVPYRVPALTSLFNALSGNWQVTYH
jgi:hypothetical protein